MPKRRNNSGEGVSLFPFMSILACLIGILTLMISVSMQVKQIQDVGRNEEEKARAVESRELTKTSKALEASTAKIQKDLERDKSTSAELAKLEDRKIILKTQVAEASKDPEKTDVQLQKMIEVMREEIAALKQGRPPLNKQLEDLKAQLALRKNPPKKVESVQIRPGGTGVRAAARLFFVECNSTGIVLLTGAGAPKSISLAAITQSQDYNALLDEVKSTRDSMVLFLIRKSGAASYNWAAGWAESKYEVLTGKLPVPNDGKIDLTLFQK